jgi:ABC-2 type transport system permease protein
MEAIFALWYRDILRFARNKGRLFGSFAMPFMFLVVFGTGMGGAIRSLMSASRTAGPLGQFNFAGFMFPGIIGMTVFTTSLFSALSVVQDREFGYLREILVSPVSRVSIAVGKILGGSTVAVIQGLLMLVFAPFAGAKLTPLIVAQLVPAMFLVAFTLSSLGLIIASLLKTSEGFQVVVQVIIFPMLFLSGVFFPLSGMPPWLNILVKINPLTYAVDLFKKILLPSGGMDPLLRKAMGLDLSVLGIPVTAGHEVAFIALAGLVFVGLAALSFSRSD